MTAIPFIVVPPRTKHPSVTAPAFVLEQDNWNDYSFQTLYHLSYYATASTGEQEVTLLGAVKILRKGQTKSDPLLVAANFERLDERYCSVGQSLDYYARLRELGDVGNYAMTALRDVVAKPELVADFKEEDGWRTSLFRDQKDVGAQFLLLARGLVDGHYAVEPKDQQSFTFSPSGWESPISVDTTSGEPWSFLEEGLPERVNVIVGRNGSGKSTLLARLARVAYASPSERLEPPVIGLGELAPEGVGFPRVVTVAFSPFDSFKLPGSDDRNRLQIAKDMRRGAGRFSFIGLRDFAAEVEEMDFGGMPLAGELSAVDDRVTRTKLKSIDQLAEEFAGYLQKVFEKGRGSVLGDALSKLERGLFSYDWTSLSKNPNEFDVARQQFLQCSTGHKIALLVVFGLVANLEARSLVLFDEPETHLHPPLLSAMMHALRGVLKEYEATAVVATHSPVVVQESMARHIHVVRREGSLTRVLPVSTETFGESIGVITAEVFGLESEATDFYQVLDGLVQRYKRLEAIEGLFKDGRLSHQARAYVLARLSSQP
ncbi:AAA family ATPase [Roseateles sp. DB2]|uniref:AAA family ATPase n=1 Tax=Roseateles sp. DB2 TaxID=3453717 RepID=UPI003EEEB8B7